MSVCVCVYVCVCVCVCVNIITDMYLRFEYIVMFFEYTDMYLNIQVIGVIAS